MELDEKVVLQAIQQNLLNFWYTDTVKLLTDLIHTRYIKKDNLNISLWIEDARISLLKLVEDKFQADAIFLDPFSPPKCPQLWTVEFLNLVAKCLKSDGILATYSCSASVRSALQLAGLQIGANLSVGKRPPGTLASYDKELLPPLSLMEIEHLKTRASVPYRDPFLNDTADNIKKKRQKEQLLSKLESTSQWKKRHKNTKFTT